MHKLYKSQRGTDIEFIWNSNDFDCELKVSAHNAILDFDSMF